MVLTLGPELTTALVEQARQHGVEPQTLALKVLQERFLGPPPLEPQDEWERQLLAIGTDCGISLSDSDLGREALYD